MLFSEGEIEVHVKPENISRRLHCRLTGTPPRSGCLYAGGRIARDGLESEASMHWMQKGFEA